MKIQLKRSNQLDGGSAKAPSLGYMEYGELAVNFNEADPCIFIKASDGAGSDSIVRIAGSGAESGGLPNGGTNERPGAPSVGDLFFDTDLNLIVYWDGSQWISVSPGVITSDSKPTESLYAAGTLWYNSDEAEGALYILYEDPAGPGANAGGKIWVQIAGSGADGSDFVSKTDTALQNIASDVTIGTDKITLDATAGSATFDGDVKIGGTLPAAPNISLNANGSMRAGSAISFNTTGARTSGQNTLVGYGPGGDASDATFVVKGNGTLRLGGTEASPNITLSANGSATFAADVTINTLTVGLGGGSVATNTAVGKTALFSNTTGVFNTAVGRDALSSNTEGSINTAIGEGALYSNTEGSENSAVGRYALFSNTTGDYNTAVGISALYSNTEGSDNTAVGLNALRLNSTGTNNTALGPNGLFSNTTGDYNTAVGISALYSNTEGSDNTAVGLNALRLNTTGDNNIAVGQNALYSNTGSGNIAIGGMNSAGNLAPAFNITTENDLIVMGSTSVTDAYVKVAWNVTSDARDKTSFAPVPYGLDFVKQLQPTAYQFKAGSRNARDPETNELIPVTAADELPSGPVRYGFKAQDILALEGDNPVIIDNADPDHLRYRGEALVPVLVNAIQEQQVLIDALTARAGERDAVIAELTNRIQTLEGGNN